MRTKTPQSTKPAPAEPVRGDAGPATPANKGGPLVRAQGGGDLGRPAPAPTGDPASSYIARLSPGSRKTQTLAVVKVCKVLGGEDPRRFPWHQITYQHSRAFLVRMETEVSSQGTGAKLAFTTVNRHIAAFRGVLKEAWRMGLMEGDAYMAATDPLKPVKGFRLPKGRQISEAELNAFLKVCRDDERVYGIRDLAMFTLMCFGLRAHEVVGVRLDAYDAQAGVVVVVGKGNKEREVAISDNAKVFIDAWLAVRPQKTPASPHLLTSENGASISPQAVDAMLERRAKEAGIDAKSLSSHDFRRTFISSLLDAGVDIVTVQRMVGHSDTSTTARYDRRGRAATKAAANKVKWGGT